jgi:hypothetical protein
VRGDHYKFTIPEGWFVFDSGEGSKPSPVFVSTHARNEYGIIVAYRNTATVDDLASEIQSMTSQQVERLSLEEEPKIQVIWYTLGQDVFEQAVIPTAAGTFTVTGHYPQGSTDYRSAFLTVARTFHLK